MASRLNLNDQQQWTRRVWLMLAAVVLLTAVFGGYYYFDRYIHLDDQSPIDQSIIQMEEVVRQNPEDADARVGLAQTYLQNGRYPQALAQTQEVLSAYPEHHGALFVQGIAYAQAGETAAAIEPLAKLVVLRRQSPMAQTDNMLQTALYYLGKSYLEVGRTDYAIDAFTEALTINHTDADAMYLLGQAYSQNDQPDLALAQYQNAVRFVPDFIEAYQGMADSYTALSQPDHAIYAQGMVAYAQRDFETARGRLETAVAALPQFAPAFLGLGITYEQLGLLTDAENYLTHALALDPDNFLASHALGRVQHVLAGQE